MSLQLIQIDTELSSDGFKSVCDLSPGQLPALQNLSNYLEAISGGNQSAVLSVKVGAIQATATVTMTGTASNNQTMKLCNQTLTAKTSGAVPADGEFNISATPNTQANSLVTAINSMTELQGLVTAARTGTGVVTITALIPGVMGNGLECADVDLGNTTVVGFANGSDGTSYTLDFE